jgi:hypothetical protein
VYTANVLLKEWKLSMKGILRREDISTPIVSLVYDTNGEVAAGVAGVDAVVSFLSDYVSILKINWV